MFSRQILLWGLYDFANSILIGNISLYFIQYIVVDKGLPDIYFSLTLTLGAVILIFLAPNIGALADNGVKKLNLIRIFSILILIGGISLSIVNNVGFLLFLFLLAEISYQLSLVPYNMTLVDIAKKEKRGIVSGFGEFSNWIGYLLGLIITLPIINGKINLFGIGKQGAFLSAALLFIVFALPFLLLHKEKLQLPKRKTRVNFVREFWETLKSLKEKEHKGVFVFLLIYLLANNAAITFTTFTPLYLEVVGKFTDQIKVLFTTIAFSLAAVGAIIGGKLSDKYGSHRILSGVIIAWALSLILVVLGSGFYYILIFVVILGLLMGAFWAIGRKFLTEMAPAQETGRFFGLYALSTRLSGFLGPPLWSISAIIFSRYGDDRYRFSMLSLSLLLIASFVLLRLCKSILVKNKI